LNRDLSKVIIIDTEAKHVRTQPENAIILPKWKGDPKDAELVNLIPFLEYIHTMQYSDVRKVLQSFDGKHIPTEFARREAIARAEFHKQLEGQRGKSRKTASTSPGGGVGMLAGMLGMKPSKMSLMVLPEGEENPQEAFAKGKMLQDIARERGRRWYEGVEKMIQEEGEKMLKEEAELQEQAQQEAMKNMKSSFAGWFGIGGKEEEEEKKTGKDDGAKTA
jgi:import inner membrane translocase subunit TIM50